MFSCSDIGPRMLSITVAYHVHRAGHSACVVGVSTGRGRTLGIGQEPVRKKALIAGVDCPGRLQEMGESLLGVGVVLENHLELGPEIDVNVQALR